MNKHIKNWFLAACGVLAVSVGDIGCGAPVDGDESADALGTTEQPYIIARDAFVSSQYGASTGSSHLRCTQTSGSVCVIPKFRNIDVFTRDPATLCPAGSTAFSSGDKALLTQVVSELDGETDLNLSYRTDNVLRVGSTNVFLCQNTVPGSLSNNIEGYSGVDTTGGVNITENQNVPHDTILLVADYQVLGSLRGTIDTADILAKTSVSAERVRLKKHAFAHAIMVGMGLGSQTTCTSSYGARAINLATSKTNFLCTFETCMTSNASVTETTDVSDISVSVLAGAACLEQGF